MKSKNDHDCPTALRRLADVRNRRRAVTRDINDRVRNVVATRNEAVNQLARLEQGSGFERMNSDSERRKLRARIAALNEDIAALTDAQRIAGQEFQQAQTTFSAALARARELGAEIPDFGEGDVFLGTPTPQFDYDDGRARTQEETQ